MFWLSRRGHYAYISAYRMDFLKVLKRMFVWLLLSLGLLTLVAVVCIAYATLVEPEWLRVRRIRLSPAPTVRVVQISDIHFKGETQYLERVVRTLNGMEADFVCFTGDLIEDPACLQGALHILSKVNKPLYGVSGNHDQWALRTFDAIRDTFRRSGGEWLTSRPVYTPGGRAALLTMACRRAPTPSGCKRILLEHHPSRTRHLKDERFDLILTGHTHGGQVRFPFVTKYVLPFDLDPYDKGPFRTPCGPLYVNPGIGTYHLKLRFLCRPEITVIEI
jgi:predicted MPP superfamily phosphohydrolase